MLASSSPASAGRPEGRSPSSSDRTSSQFSSHCLGQEEYVPLSLPPPPPSGLISSEATKAEAAEVILLLPLLYLTFMVNARRRSEGRKERRGERYHHPPLSQSDPLLFSPLGPNEPSDRRRRRRSQAPDAAQSIMSSVYLHPSYASQPLGFFSLFTSSIYSLVYSSRVYFPRPLFFTCKMPARAEQCHTYARRTERYPGHVVSSPPLSLFSRSQRTFGIHLRPYTAWERGERRRPKTDGRTDGETNARARLSFFLSFLPSSSSARSLSSPLSSSVRLLLFLPLLFSPSPSRSGSVVRSIFAFPSCTARDSTNVSPRNLAIPWSTPFRHCDVLCYTLVQLHSIGEFRGHLPPAFLSE